MISLRNAEKILRDHPDIPCPKLILAQAQGLSRKGVLSVIALTVLFPGRSTELAREIEINEEHIRINQEDLKNAQL